jgi:hypothetical protein
MNLLFTAAELFARADVFRRTYKGSGQPGCRVNQSLSITRAQAVNAHTQIRRVRGLLNHLKVDEVGMALDLVLRETERDIVFGESSVSSSSSPLVCVWCTRNRCAGSLTDPPFQPTVGHVGLQVCGWKETLEMMCGFHPWDQQVRLFVRPSVPPRVGQYA